MIAMKRNILTLGDVNLAIYDKDYQLARAIDLVRGVSVYKSSVSK